MSWWLPFEPQLSSLFFQDIWHKFKYLIEIKHLKSSFATEKKTFCVCHYGDLNPWPSWWGGGGGVFRSHTSKWSCRASREVNESPEAFPATCARARFAGCTFMGHIILVINTVSWLVRNSVALLSLAKCCRWWDHKARKWYYHSIQGEEEADGHDWSEILLLVSHWLNVAGGGITRPESGTITASRRGRGGRSWLVRNSAAWLSLAECCRWLDHKTRKGTTTAYKERRRWTVMIGQKFCCFSLIGCIAGGGITRPESGTTTAYKERRRRTVMISQKFCCSALIGCIFQVVGSQGQKVVLPQHSRRGGGGRSLRYF